MTASGQVDEGTTTCSTAAGVASYYGFYLPVQSRVRFYGKTGAQTSPLVVSVRRRCDDRTSDVRCESDAWSLFDGPAITGGTFGPGPGTLIVDGLPSGGSAELDYDIVPDPCAAIVPCPLGQQPVQSVDWTTCDCACPEGQVADGDSCAPDPCVTTTCSGEKSRCTVQTASLSLCECPLGEVPDAAQAGVCAADSGAAEWTVMVYESLVNNLGQGITGPTLLGGEVGENTPVNVVWLHATPSEDATVYHVGHGSALESVATWAHPDMSDWRTLRDFGLLAATQYPARHYAMVIVDHGGDL